MQYFRFSLKECLGKYLGYPMMQGRNKKKKLFSPLLEEENEMMSNWSKKTIPIYTNLESKLVHMMQYLQMHKCTLGYKSMETSRGSYPPWEKRCR